MTEALSIRLYQAGDEPAVVALARELQRHEHARYEGMKPPDEIGPWYVEALLESVSASKGAFFVAELEGRVVGYAALLGEISTEDEKDMAVFTYSHVADLVVAEALRSRGIGEALLARCEASARELGTRFLRLALLAKNEGARRFYRRQGLEDYLVIMEKPL